MVNRVRNIVILTGAGISADSGIATFRASDGLWENHPVDVVATPEGYAENPELVTRFYNERRAQLMDPDTKPNPAHYALVELEAHLNKSGGSLTIVTQNVDDLHQRAGSQSVYPMHGELRKVRCVRSGRVYPWDRAVLPDDRCECCDAPQPLRPHIVWFGEMPLYMNEIYHHLGKADLFVAIGTSGNVYPAAGFVSEAKMAGIPTLEINLEPGANRSVFDYSLYGRAAIKVPEWADHLMATGEFV